MNKKNRYYNYNTYSSDTSVNYTSTGRWDYWVTTYTNTSGGDYIVYPYLPKIEWESPTKECDLCHKDIDIIDKDYAIVKVKGKYVYLCWDCVVRKIGELLVPVLL